jgi:hypothetical protein
MQSREAATSDEVFRATWAELGGVLDELLGTVAEVGAHGLADANPADLERWDEAIRCVVTRLDELDTTGARP